MEEADKRYAHARTAAAGGEMMDITEEIKLLERKVELLERVKELEDAKSTGIPPYIVINPYPWLYPYQYYASITCGSDHT
jgi:hypothetical protein